MVGALMMGCIKIGGCIEIGGCIINCGCIGSVAVMEFGLHCNLGCIVICAVL